MYVDPRIADPAYRQRTWKHLQECTARGEALAREQQQQIIEEGAQEGDTVRLSPFLTGQVVEIRCNGLEMPQALVVSEQPTGRRGETATRSEWVPLKGLQVVQPAMHSTDERSEDGEALQQAPESLFLADPPAAQSDAGTEPESDATIANT